MKMFGYTRLIIPALVLIAGIANLMNTSITGELRTLWMFLTPFAGILLIVRLWLLYKVRKGRPEDE